MSKYYSAIATVGAVALLLGAALQITQLAWAPYLYLIGAIMFAYVQVMSGYEGKNHHYPPPAPPANNRSNFTGCCRSNDDSLETK